MDVEQWIPERWLDENNRTFNSKQGPKQVVWPFGGGTRLCIGNNLADTLTTSDTGSSNEQHGPGLVADSLMVALQKIV
ncbi:hypothetical protein BBP40_002618 [Aspergillus hancockii]|nr:hypothetical protein BBP40_002618 [Aspergillus hancockii]